MADANPQQRDTETVKLHALYRDVARLIQLTEAGKAPRILIDGDIEVAWPESVKQQVKDRIATKTVEIAAKVAELKNAVD